MVRSGNWRSYLIMLLLYFTWQVQNITSNKKKPQPYHRVLLTRSYCVWCKNSFYKVYYSLASYTTSHLVLLVLKTRLVNKSVQHVECSLSLDRTLICTYFILRGCKNICIYKTKSFQEFYLSNYIETN